MLSVLVRPQVRPHGRSRKDGMSPVPRAEGKQGISFEWGIAKTLNCSCGVRGTFQYVSDAHGCRPLVSFHFLQIASSWPPFARSKRGAKNTIETSIYRQMPVYETALPLCLPLMHLSQIAFERRKGGIARFPIQPLNCRAQVRICCRRCTSAACSIQAWYFTETPS